uniref:Uncharacterized protein n=1 Tax=Caenorhabditis japonica TaxID=281687 RepID=A0A8R1ISX8_CAEJA
MKQFISTTQPVVHFCLCSSPNVVVCPFSHRRRLLLLFLVKELRRSDVPQVAARAAETCGTLERCIKNKKKIHKFVGKPKIREPNFRGLEW